MAVLINVNVGYLHDILVLINSLPRYLAYDKQTYWKWMTISGKTA